MNDFMFVYHVEEEAGKEPFHVKSTYQEDKILICPERDGRGDGLIKCSDI